jgi:hypothetical protein
VVKHSLSVWTGPLSESGSRMHKKWRRKAKRKTFQRHQQAKTVTLKGPTSSLPVSKKRIRKCPLLSCNNSSISTTASRNEAYHTRYLSKKRFSIRESVGLLLRNLHKKLSPCPGSPLSSRARATPHLDAQPASTLLFVLELANADACNEAR